MNAENLHLKRDFTPAEQGEGFFGVAGMGLDLERGFWGWDTCRF